MRGAASLLNVFNAHLNANQTLKTFLMLSQILVKILNHSYNTFKMNGFFINPLKLLEETSAAIGCKVSYPMWDVAMVTFPDGVKTPLRLTNSGQWEVIQ